jgi:hypothetical protein
MNLDQFKLLEHVYDDYGRVNVLQVRNDMRQEFARWRKVLTEFSERSASMGDSRARYLNLLEREKLAANDLRGSRVLLASCHQIIRSHLAQQARRRLLSLNRHGQNSAQSSSSSSSSLSVAIDQRAVKSLRAIAKRLSLADMLDEGAEPTWTLYSEQSNLVVDLVFAPPESAACCSFADVRAVRLTELAFESPRDHKELTDALRCANLSVFERRVAEISRVDALACQFADRDLRALYARACDQAAQLVADELGLDVSRGDSPSALLVRYFGDEWHARLSIEHGREKTSARPALDDDDDASDGGGDESMAPLRYVLLLEPPVLSTVASLRGLLATFGGAGAQARKRVTSRAALALLGGQPQPRGCRVPSRHTQASASCVSALSSRLTGGRSACSLPLLDNEALHTYTIADPPSSNSSDHEPVVLHRLPLSRVADVTATLQFLRQQVCFNTLYRSCFPVLSDAAAALGSNHNARRFTVELATRSPSRIVATSHAFSLDVRIEHSAQISAAVHRQSAMEAIDDDDDDDDDDDEGERIASYLSKTNNLPLVLHCSLLKPN